MFSKSNTSDFIVFFDAKNVVHKRFIPPRQTVNATYYVDFVERKSVLRVRKETSATWVFNATSHTSLHVREFLAIHVLATLPQPFYGPDLDPVDFFLFLRTKIALKIHRFEGIEVIHAIQDYRHDYFEQVSHRSLLGQKKKSLENMKICADEGKEYFKHF